MNKELGTLLASRAERDWKRVIKAYDWANARCLVFQKQYGIEVLTLLSASLPIPAVKHIETQAPETHAEDLSQNGTSRTKSKKAVQRIGPGDLRLLVPEIIGSMASGSEITISDVSQEIEKMNAQFDKQGLSQLLRTMSENGTLKPTKRRIPSGKGPRQRVYRVP